VTRRKVGDSMFIAYAFAPNYRFKKTQTLAEAQKWIKDFAKPGQYCEVIDCKQNNKIVFCTTNER
jgi:hypothetical protein